MMKEGNLEPLFRPESVAIVGASKDPEKRSGIPLRELLKAGYGGSIYPVNPKYDEIEGLKCHDSIKDIDDEIDVALIALPSKIAPKAIEECASAGVKSAVIISAGWREIGGEGAERQEKIKRIAQESGMRICGPNTLGMISFDKKATLTYLSPRSLNPGSVGVIFQSGALSASIKYNAEERGIDFSNWVSTGNEADLTALDYADYMIDDSKTDIIIVYMEGIEDGDKFKSVAKEAVEEKVPLAIYKVGRSEIGKQQTETHTGSLAGSYTAYKTFFKQYGIIQADSREDLLDIAVFVANHGVCDAEKIGIASFSGGATVEFADKSSGTSLEIPDYTDQTKQNLSSLLSERVVKKNPLDLAGDLDPDEYGELVKILAKDEKVDVVTMLLGWWEERAKVSGETLAKVQKEIEKPLVVVWDTPRSITQGGIENLENNGVPVYPSIERCVKTLSKINSYNKFLEEK